MFLCLLNCAPLLGLRIAEPHVLASPVPSRPIGDQLWPKREGHLMPQVMYLKVQSWTQHTIVDGSLLLWAWCRVISL